MTFPPWVAPASRVAIGALVVLALGDAAGRDDLTVVRVLGGVLAVTAGWISGHLVVHGRMSTAGVVLVAGGPCAYLLAGGDSASIGWFVLVFLAGQAGVTLQLGVGALAFAGLLATLAFAALVEPDQGWGNWVPGAFSGFAGGALFRKQAELAERSRAAEAAAERARIAHELHDVVAHTLAVSVLHLGAARVAVDHEPERAADALAEAERLARSSMAELRRVVGALADGSAVDEAAPGAADVVDLVDEYRRAGVAVDLRVDGDLAAIDAPRGLVVFRIVQEALANAVRHAPGVPITVEAAVEGSKVIARVVNPLPVGAATGSPGHGLAGMAARASAVGGSAEAAPDGDRWVVRAELPVG